MRRHSAPLRFELFVLFFEVIQRDSAARIHRPHPLGEQRPQFILRFERSEIARQLDPFRQWQQRGLGLDVGVAHDGILFTRLEHREVDPEIRASSEVMRVW